MPGTRGNVRTILPVVHPPDLDVGINREAVIPSRGIEIRALVYPVSSRISGVHTIRIWNEGGSVERTHEILVSRANRARGTARVKSGCEDPFRGFPTIKR